MRTLTTTTIKPLVVALLFTAVCILFLTDKTYSQKTKKTAIVLARHPKGETKINDSTFLSFLIYKGACKSNNLSFQLTQLQILPGEGLNNQGRSGGAKNDFIHGDVTYDYFYRSAIDTPFAGSNIQQHNLRANLQVMVAKQIPVTIQVNSRQTNSPLFKNYTDLNVQFNSRSYNTAARDKLAKAIVQKIEAQARDSFLLKTLNHHEHLQALARQWLDDPRQLQQLVENRQIVAAGEAQLKSRLEAAGENAKNRIEDSVQNREDRIKNRVEDSIRSRENRAKNRIEDSVQSKENRVKGRIEDSLQNKENRLQNKIEDSVQSREAIVKNKAESSLAFKTDSLKNSQEDSSGNKAGQSSLATAVKGASGLLHGTNITKINSLSSLGQYTESNKEVLAQKLVDSIGHTNSKAAKFIETYKAREAQYEKGKKTVDSLREVYNTAKENTSKKIEDAKSTLSGGNNDAVSKKVKEYGLDTSKVFKWYKRINAIQQLSLGRSMADYSELSAKNISITGVQATVQNKFYIAIASGAVDYRYRDFIVRGYSPVKQYLNLVRFGIGAPASNNLVLTVYQGKKQANYFTAANQPAANKVFGITLQGKFRLNENNYIIAEGAKSSYPQTLVANTTTTLNNGTGNKTFSLSNHSNEAYSIQLFSRIPGTGTRIYGQYKYLGRNFQSFSVFNVNSDFTAWQARVDQYFLKKKLFVTAGLRTNDYSNPYITTAFKTNTVFKSLQATLRLKKWPVLSVGYMPSSQITSIGNQVVENRFYTLTASANYMYRIRKNYMHTGLVYTRFYNGAPDTSFIYYNASNWFIYHHIIGSTFSFNSVATLSYNNTYRLFTIDEGLTYKLNKNLSAGGGLKWNHLNSNENHMGYYGSLQFRIIRIGDFNLSLDRGFIPGINGQLLRNDFGRATYIKTF